MDQPSYSRHLIMLVLLLAAGIILIATAVWSPLTPTISSQPADQHMLPQKKQVETHTSPETDTVPAMSVSREPGDDITPPTSPALPLALIGTSIQKQNAFAVFLDTTTGKQHLVRTGDVIRNAVLKEIQSNHVRLQRETEMITLFIQAAKRDEPPAGSPPVQKPPLSPEEIAARYNHDDDINEVMALMDQIDFSPSPKDSQIKGVIVRQVRPDSVFEKIGLQPDDLLISIDGKKIESIDDSFEIYETLRTSRNGTILIQRENYQQTLFYQNDFQ